MRKKIIFLSIIVIALACLLVGCSNEFKVTKKSHDVIVQGAESTYIAVDEGKSYLYNMKNSKKLIKKGYDKLSYMPAVGVSETCEDYFLAYNNGDIGYAVLNQKGEQVIASTTDMKIEYAYLLQDITRNADSLINVGFVNGENQSREAVFKLNGAAVFYDKNGEVYYEGYEDDESYNYVMQYIVGFVYDADGEETSIEIFDSELKSIYRQTYGENLKYEWSFFEEGSALGYIKNKSIDDGVTRISVIAGSELLSGYTGVLETLRDEEQVVQSYIAEKYNKNTVAYHLIGVDGELKSLDNYAVFGDNIHVSVGSDDKIDVFNYAGDSILNNVTFGDGYYAKTNNETDTIFSTNGKKLFEVPSTTSINMNNDSFQDIKVEWFVLFNDQDEVSYKFFHDDMLVKEYGQEFSLEWFDFNNACACFTKENLDAFGEYVYYYDYASNVERRKETNDDNVYDDFMLFDHDEKAQYYVEKESNSIVFYSGISGIISPYDGDKVPSYSVNDGGHKFTTKRFDWSSFRYITLEYEALTKTPVPDSEPLEYTYESTGEKLYAYYMVEGFDLGSKLVELYSGYNMVNVHMDSNDKVVVASTIDYFANLEDNGLQDQDYVSFENLENKTRVFEIVMESRDADTFEFKLAHEFDKSNVIAVVSDKYLLATEYVDVSFNRDTVYRDVVYKFDGTVALAGKYHVADIAGDLVLVELGTAKGIFSLEKGKLLEDIKYGEIELLNANLYGVVTNEKNGPMMTFKDAKGKKIVANCHGYEYINSIIDIENDTITEYYAIYLGKGKEKLMSVTYKEPLDI